MGASDPMDWFQQYWWAILLGIAVLVLLALLLRPRQRVRLTDSAPLRPHMAPPPAEGRGLAGEAAAGASDLAGTFVSAPVHAKLSGGAATGDDLTQLKGVGPKLAADLNALGFTRFAQIAALSANELDRLDGQLGAFRGRLSRDRVVEQADYLARGDVDGFEQRFGKL